MRSHLLTVALGLSLASVASAQTACNGNAALCDRKYSNVTLVGSHDSAFVGSFVTDNQYVSVADQLGLGVRFLQAQTHSWLGGIELCHTSCLELDAGPLSSYLSTVKTWMDANPNEVLTMLLTNGDSIDVSEYGNLFEEAGLTEYTYAPTGQLSMDDWPTLRTMINEGNRLVVFMDYHANTAEVPYILDEFSYIFETPYDTTDPTFPECTLNRPPGASPAGLMMLVNHFLDIAIFSIDIPDMIAAARTNSDASILAQSDICYSDYSRVPNFILLDWINVGDPFDVQNELNNLS